MKRLLIVTAAMLCLGAGGERPASDVKVKGCVTEVAPLTPGQRVYLDTSAVLGQVNGMPNWSFVRPPLSHVEKRQIKIYASREGSLHVAVPDRAAAAYLADGWARSPGKDLTLDDGYRTHFSVFSKPIRRMLAPPVTVVLVLLPPEA